VCNVMMHTIISTSCRQFSERIIFIRGSTTQRKIISMMITVWPVSRVEINFLEILQTCRKDFSRAWQSDKFRLPRHKIPNTLFCTLYMHLSSFESVTKCSDILLYFEKRSSTFFFLHFLLFF
jgi:hypothetical protein